MRFPRHRDAVLVAGAFLLFGNVAHATSYIYRVPVPGLQATTAGVPSTDPYWAEVTALLTMDGANGSTTISDVKGGSYTLSGGAALTTSTAAFGSASLSVVSGYMRGPSSAVTFGTGDFTVEMFVQGKTSGVTYELFDTRPSGTNGAYLTIGTPNTGGAAGGLQVYVNATAVMPTSTVVPVDGKWHHFAYSRNSGTGRMFFDGALIGSWTDNTNYSTSPFGVGWNAFGVTEDGFDVDELRITVGVGRYTANFAVPPAAFPTQ